MKKHSKAFNQAAEKVHKDRLYQPLEAFRLAKEISSTKFDSTVDAVFRLTVDPRKSDQMIRGTVSLPNGTGKTVRVLVFANSPKDKEALEA